MRDENKINLLTIGESVWKMLAWLFGIGLIISGIGVGVAAIVGAAALAYFMLSGWLFAVSLLFIGVILFGHSKGSSYWEEDFYFDTEELDWSKYRNEVIKTTAMLAFETVVLFSPVSLAIGLAIGGVSLPLFATTVAVFLGIMMLPAIGIVCGEGLWYLGAKVLSSIPNLDIANSSSSSLSAPAPSVGNVPMITAHPAADPLQMASAPEFNINLPLPIASANSSSSSTAQLLQTQGLFAEKAYAIAQSEETIPDHFLCPITHEKINDPVVAADGYSYEKTAIEQWLAQHKTSPMTGAALLHRMLIPNHNLRSQIRAAESALSATLGR
jgi:hypothetical protein